MPSTTAVGVATRAALEGPRGSTRARRLWSAYVRLAPAVALVLLVGWGVRLGGQLVEASQYPGSIGIDYRAVMDGTNRWVATGSPYLPRQLEGPYLHLGANSSDSGEFLYPPIVLPFLWGFALLPGIAWWTGAVVVAVLALRWLRPARWSWPMLILLASVGQGVPLVIAGNPTMWVTAVALCGLRPGWPAAFAVLKPSLWPVALLGVHARSWWITIAILAVVAVPFGTLWLEWYHALVDLDSAGPLFAFSHVAFVSVPVIATIASPRRTEARTPG